MRYDDRPQCKGMTAGYAAASGSGNPDVPSRRCRSKARTGREYCAAHEPDEEFNAARRHQNALGEKEREAGRRRRLHEAEDDRDRAVARRMAQLDGLLLKPDANPHRCRATGVLSYRFSGYEYGQELLPELVQCDSYVEHPEGRHVCLAAENSYGEATVEWRDR